MISLSIPEVKTFMAKLFSNTIFDTFILKDMEIQTYTRFHISGQFNYDFFTSDELEERELKAILWSDVKGIAYHIIKGNKTPLTLKIVLQLPVQKQEEILEKLTNHLRKEEVGGLYLNVRFEKGKLFIVSATSIKTFTLDKSLEQEWDLEMKHFLKEYGIVYEE